ncbi:hypothetical protein [Roseibium sp. M-1]
MADLQDHHLIPQILWPDGKGNHHKIFDIPNLLDEIQRDNRKYNIMGLPEEFNPIFQKHVGRHDKYTEVIEKKVRLDPRKQ